MACHSTATHRPGTMGLSRALYGSLLAMGFIACGEAFVARGGVSSFAHCLHPVVPHPKTELADATRRPHALFAEGPSGGGSGAPTPNGPGTPNLSREAKLLISVLIDVIGVSSFAVPGVGEATDLGWAPISSALIFYLYGNSIFAGLAFVEEILPGFDVIPTATIAWFLTNSEVGQNVTNAAAGKRGVGGASTSAPPPPPPPSPSASRGRGSRKVDDDLVQSGVIDVDSQ